MEIVSDSGLNEASKLEVSGTAVVGLNVKALNDYCNETLMKISANPFIYDIAAKVVEEMEEWVNEIAVYDMLLHKYAYIAPRNLKYKVETMRTALASLKKIKRENEKIPSVDLQEMIEHVVEVCEEAVEEDVRWHGPSDTTYGTVWR